VRACSLVGAIPYRHSRATATSSFPRKRESTLRPSKSKWIPAFAGMIRTSVNSPCPLFVDITYYWTEP
jgi:hypothetical protein